MSKITWEQAVRWYREQPGNEQAVKENFFDLPVIDAAKRYAASEEFAEVLRLLGMGRGRRCLDLGAGNGIASYALAVNGWHAVALEPDPSDEVGAGAIRALTAESGLPIEVVQEVGEKLPFPDASFDAIHARQVLHHLSDLDQGVKELTRVLKRGGKILTTRDHVADDTEQLEAFYKKHALHFLYGGENAHPLARYRQAFQRAGLVVEKEWGLYESILNYFPKTEEMRRAKIRKITKKSFFGWGRHFVDSESVSTIAAKREARRDKSPGRLYSFLLRKS